MTGFFSAWQKPLQSKAVWYQHYNDAPLFTLSMSVECPLDVPAPSCWCLISHCLMTHFCTILIFTVRVSVFVLLSPFWIEFRWSSPWNLEICWQINKHGSFQMIWTSSPWEHSPNFWVKSTFNILVIQNKQVLKYDDSERIVLFLLSIYYYCYYLI